MSNKIQMTCNPQNSGYKFLLEETWKRIGETHALIRNLEIERRELIIYILFMKKRNKLIPLYVTERISQIPTLITAWEYLLDCEFNSIIEISRRIIVC